MRPTHHDRHRIRQIADPFSKTSRFWTLFTQWVCTLATTPPQTASSPPPNGGNCIIRGATRRRYSASQLLMLQNPHHSQPEVRRIVYKSLAQHRLARQRGDIETNNTTAHLQQGTTETDITSAPEKRTKHTRFSPAKAMAVSVAARPAPAKVTAVSNPRKHARAKATGVSDNRAAWSTGLGRGARLGFEA